MRDAPAAKVADLVLGRVLAGLQLDPGEHRLPQALIGQSAYIDVGDLGVGVQKFLDFARIDIFAAADDHLLDAAGDMKSAVGPHSSQVAGVQPAFRVYSARSGFGLAIIAFHHQITARAQLATLTDLDGRAA